jgi:hypothetical protein
MVARERRKQTARGKGGNAKKAVSEEWPKRRRVTPRAREAEAAKGVRASRTERGEKAGGK